MSSVECQHYMFHDANRCSDNPEFPDIYQPSLDELTKTYSEYIHSNAYSLNYTQEIKPQIHTYVNHDGQSYQIQDWWLYRELEIQNYPNIDNSREYEFEREPSASRNLPPPHPQQWNISLWEIHQSKILYVLNQIAHITLDPLKKAPYQIKRVCLGHDLYNNYEIKSKNKRQRAREESEKHIKAYEQNSSDYYKCITTSIGLEDPKSKKFRFFAKVFHTDDHTACKGSTMKFFPLNEEAENHFHIDQEDTVKKCLGHVEFLNSFIQTGKGNEGLRELSTEALAYFSSHTDFKSGDEGILKTHAFQRLDAACSQNDLFIFYQHQDDHKNCDQFCEIPKKALQYIASESLAEKTPCLSLSFLNDENSFPLSVYTDALDILDQTIESDPSYSDAYLQRSIAHFELENYDAFLNDFKKYDRLTTDQTNLKLTSDFSKNFVSELVRGAKDSASHWALLAVDLIKHPIRTTEHAFNAFEELSHLALSDQWGELCETLSPEAYQLATEWKTLPADQRGKLAGYAIGKLGTDLFIPGAVAKATSKGVKGAKELVKISKNVQKAESTLVLESMATLENSTQVAEVVQKNQKIAYIANETELSTREMFKLKQAGELESHLQKIYTDQFKTPLMQESFELLEKAQKALKPYKNQFMPEAKIRELIQQTGIPTFPRPQGIPENFLVQITDKGAGMKYIHPHNKQTLIRVMPGKLHSPNLHQQNPYIIHMKDGMAYNLLGEFVLDAVPEAHIPIKDFQFRN